MDKRKYGTRGEISWQPWEMQIGKARSFAPPCRRVSRFSSSFVLISTCIFPPSRGNIILLFKTGCAVWKSNAETRYNDSQFSNFFSRSPPVSSEFYIFFLLYGGKQRNIIFHSNCEIQFFPVVVGEKLRSWRCIWNFTIWIVYWIIFVEALVNTWISFH